ncbi:MAG: hypothetical protein COA94_02490 [Rickettsiales bacterium]|nr:MAG: hypothetical protein COA94_02490 [Rickettsiales bacterium]
MSLDKRGDYWMDKAVQIWLKNYALTAEIARLEQQKGLTPDPTIDSWVEQVVDIQLENTVLAAEIARLEDCMPSN